jgi:hypothetical protein
MGKIHSDWSLYDFELIKVQETSATWILIGSIDPLLSYDSNELPIVEIGPVTRKKR